ncbi:MAG: SUMF1/EgtB/PvdO family nonheme iron enzyme [Acidobacteria bacterium]|nr:SUMF1/EgtB/PvdO family nonheme iron enzyme [Acidobacteriota bacterium]MBI3658645.1 SUMF1/EgtB/PvdO family nonheme iron enzyme [Acidobacteriota bacterium]
MLKRALLAFIILGLIGGWVGCSSKEEKSAKSEETPPAPTIKPGEMVLIPAGAFKMGSNQKGEDGKPTPAYPERDVDLPAYYIDKYEVTNGEFLKFTADTGYTSEAEAENKSWRLFFSPERVNYPAVNLTWNDANAYAKWAGKRLPTEAEWEKAARGTDGWRYPWGNEWVAGRSNTAETGFRQPREIGSYPGDESPFKVMDMLGNVQEWVADWYKAYPGNPKKEKEYGEVLRCARGGTSSHIGKMFSLWARTAYLPKALFGLGMRCVKDAQKANLQTDPNDRIKELNQKIAGRFDQIALAVHHSFGPHRAKSAQPLK